ncbi:hypothetical protein DL240_03080 [Lujinxingia litoralis]|uniref:Uncharacterized protein n=1 Tax=Lujinxingia litoralis TaxID=2211119 RepID=A0A328CB09_9DELT|nr:hypothetical protein [Lujinxingia litoralis]RAL25208.1 hypothetical protein DL240_03080 [Lujinxingia litoralis]
MALKNENENSHAGLHPALVAITWEAGHRWTAALWEDRGSDLKGALQGLVEARLLAALSVPPAQYLEERQAAAPLSFDVALYTAVGSAGQAALRELGFAPVDEAFDRAALERLSVFRNEARRVGALVPEDPLELWRLEISRPEPTLKRVIEEACTAAATRQAGKVFGEQPGWPSKVLVDQIGARISLQVTPDVAGLERLAALLIDASPGTLGWVEPVAFQALCDLLAVVLQAAGKGPVEWATSPVDAISGLAPPPMVRVRRRGSWRALWLGRDLMRGLLLPWSRQAPGDALKAMLADYLR